MINAQDIIDESTGNAWSVRRADVGHGYTITRTHTDDVLASGLSSEQAMTMAEALNDRESALNDVDTTHAKCNVVLSKMLEQLGESEDGSFRVGGIWSYWIKDALGLVK